MVTCTALLVGVWLLRLWSWHATAVAVAGALALASWFAQLHDLVPPSPPGIAYGFTPYAELGISHPVDFHGLPGVLLFASLAVTAVCTSAPSRRHPSEVDGEPRQVSKRAQ